ncbi:hypothetical protein ACQP3D_25800, partial [Escherichia coli]
CCFCAYPSSPQIPYSSTHSAAINTLVPVLVQNQACTMAPANVLQDSQLLWWLGIPDWLLLHVLQYHFLKG